ncbi:MAG: hypothetical protein ACTHMX_07785 [Thermomicrobiales bacterium]
MTGGLPGMTVDDVVNPSGTGRNCVEGAAGIALITLNGMTGTISGSQVVWSDVSGDVDIFAPVAAVSGGSRSITEDTNLVATFYISDITPTPGTPGQVNIGIDQCHVATGPQSWIGIGAPEGFSDCFAVTVADKEWGLRIDGTRPTSFSGNVATWSGLSNGAHVATTESGARYEFTVQDNELFLSAIFGPNGAASGGGSSIATVTPAPSLPNTGVGAEAAGGTPVAALLVASLTMLTLVVAGGLLHRTDRT